MKMPPLFQLQFGLWEWKCLPNFKWSLRSEKQDAIPSHVLNAIPEEGHKSLSCFSQTPVRWVSKLMAQVSGFFFVFVFCSGWHLPHISQARGWAADLKLLKSSICHTGYWSLYAVRRLPAQNIISVIGPKLYQPATICCVCYCRILKVDGQVIRLWLITIMYFLSTESETKNDGQH